MDTDVVVVGAGPTGLMLAGELRLGGARVVLVERLAEPTGQSRGLGFTARTVEVFDQRGLLPAFGEVETSAVGHFGGLLFDYTVLEGAHFGARSIPQSRTEAVLEEWALGLGADIRRGWEFTGLNDDGSGVDVTVSTPDGQRTLRAAYLVGCDGGQSPVRRAAGFDFPGSPATREMYLADVVGCDLRPRFLGERVAGGMVMSAPLGGGVDRVIICERGVPPTERAEPPTFAEVAAAWQRLTGEDISGGSASWVSSFTDAARQVAHYRRGRVLLAGDAAHIHLPAGGQGLSTGVQDAVNLGWKLAAEVRGTAAPGLLDSYHAERHPVGARLLMNTRAQGVLFLSGEEVEPLREVFAELIAYPDVSRHLAGMVSHLEVAYEVAEGDHPLLGRRLPKRSLTTSSGETTTTELLHTGRGVLLDLADDPKVREIAEDWSDRVTCVTAAVIGAEPDDVAAGTAAVLVRPDGYVAWTSPGGGDLAVALERWFGPLDRG
ncbi:FAD-dependent monooxygenase [Saccharothrix syringae]|uniref:Monooxygenase n=1 Tax=Saccharothrix syringae TaxID=103733 RepID=A0A5Q0H5G5_SACSY|nr:FAD-dependent monooxygenase [Saccharothrix syringae]QFZ21436.1 monooxygenase [Saccharothrix syringae]